MCVLLPKMDHTFDNIRNLHNCLCVGCFILGFSNQLPLNSSVLVVTLELSRFLDIYYYFIILLVNFVDLLSLLTLSAYMGHDNFRKQRKQIIVIGVLIRYCSQ